MLGFARRSLATTTTKMRECTTTRKLLSFCSTTTLTDDVVVDGEKNQNKNKNSGMLEVNEVERILQDVKADDVKIIPTRSSSDRSSSWTDFVVVATGRSPWHVRNIAQALIHRVKEKQKGAEHLLLPRVQGYQGGKWVVVDSGNLVIHALDEKARTYYNLEELFLKRASSKPSQEEDIELRSL